MSPTPVMQGRLAIVGVQDPQPGWGGRHDVFLMDLDGSKIVKLIPGAVWIDNVAWSPDGQKLVMDILMLDRHESDIYVVNADGTGLTRIKPSPDGLVGFGSGGTDPAWSPDGKQIVFSYGGAPLAWIHIMNADGSGVRYLTKGDVPTWSPDGQSIVFVKRHILEPRGVPDLFGDLYVIGVDGQGLRQLTSDIYADRPIWSPDGQRIAFYGHEGSISWGVYVIDADGSNRRRVFDGVRPSWLPDGKHLLAVGDDGVYVVDVDGTWSQRISTLPSNFWYIYAVLQPQAP